MGRAWKLIPLAFSFHQIFLGSSYELIEFISLSYKLDMGSISSQGLLCCLLPHRMVYTFSGPHWQMCWEFLLPLLAQQDLYKRSKSWQGAERSSCRRSREQQRGQAKVLEQHLCNKGLEQPLCNKTFWNNLVATKTREIFFFSGARCARAGLSLLWLIN